MLELLNRIAVFLSPPVGNKPEEVAKWRAKVVGAVVLLFLSQALYIVVAGGFLGAIGIESGFATKAEVVAQSVQLDSLTRKFDASQKSSLENQMFDKRVQQCQADPGSPLRRAYAAQIETLQMRYRPLNQNLNFILPACSDLTG